jgi:hypothetical protein
MEPETLTEESKAKVTVLKMWGADLEWTIVSAVGCSLLVGVDFNINVPHTWFDRPTADECITDAFEYVNLLRRDYSE